MPAKRQIMISRQLEKWIVMKYEIWNTGKTDRTAATEKLSDCSEWHGDLSKNFQELLNKKLD